MRRGIRRPDLGRESMWEDGVVKRRGGQERGGEERMHQPGEEV